MRSGCSRCRGPNGRGIPRLVPIVVEHYRRQHHHAPKMVRKHRENYVFAGSVSIVGSGDMFANGGSDCPERTFAEEI